MIAVIFWALLLIGIFAAVWELELIRQILTSIKDVTSSKRPDQR
jgi:hypothetical protein